MDKVAEHKRIVKTVFEEVLNFFPKDSHVELLPIVDETSGQFLIYTDGWEKSWRDYACFFHVQVMNDSKVYLRHDGTDLEIANKLIEKGISKKDIVLAFHAPYMRDMSGFAAA